MEGVMRSRIEWDGPDWRLRVVDQRLADGTVKEMGIVDHPGAVVIVALLEGQVLMVEQYRLAISQRLLELPAGTRDPDEDWLACARRELREETGYRAEKWTQMGLIWVAPGVSNERLAVYLAEDLAADALPADADEEITVRTVALNELVGMAIDGRLQDAKSVVAALRASAYLAMGEK
jgi:ADP-ribose pyrophosphatase